METMRNMDKKGSGFIENGHFINGVCESGFDTNEREMRKVSLLIYFPIIDNEHIVEKKIKKIE